MFDGLILVWTEIQEIKVLFLTVNPCNVMIPNPCFLIVSWLLMITVSVNVLESYRSFGAQEGHW